MLNKTLTMFMSLVRRTKIKKIVLVFIGVLIFVYLGVFNRYGSDAVGTVWLNLNEPAIEGDFKGVQDLWDFGYVSPVDGDSERYSLGGVSPINGVIFTISRLDSLQQSKAFRRYLKYMHMVDAYHQTRLVRVYVKRSFEKRIEGVALLCGEYMVELYPFAGRDVFLDALLKRVLVLVPRCAE